MLQKTKLFKITGCTALMVVALFANCLIDRRRDRNDVRTFLFSDAMLLGQDLANVESEQIETDNFSGTSN